MEEVLGQIHISSMDKGGNVVLDIESLAQSSDKCSGSPKLTKALSRKGSCRMERRNTDDLEADDVPKRVGVKALCSQLEQLKQLPASSKALVAVTTTANSTSLSDSGEGRNKRFNRFLSVNPRKILLFFATMSSMGTMILIYFTLAINRRDGL